MFIGSLSGKVIFKLQTKEGENIAQVEKEEQTRQRGKCFTRLQVQLSVDFKEATRKWGSCGVMQGRGMKSDAGCNKCNIIQFADHGKELELFPCKVQREGIKELIGGV